MAVDNENLTPKVRASDELLKPDPKRPALETPSKKTKHSQPSSEVQVPSTLPQYDQEDGPGNNVPQLEQTRSKMPGNLTEATEEDRENETELTEPDSNAELSQMDWAGFQKRYRDAIQQAHDDETRLLEEFEKYFEVGNYSIAVAVANDPCRCSESGLWLHPSVIVTEVGSGKCLKTCLLGF